MQESGSKAQGTIVQNTTMLVNTMFNEVECFSSTHVLHTCLCIASSLVLIMITLIMVLLYVESRKHNEVILGK